MDLEEQVKTYRELVRKIEELEAQKKALGHSILQQMSSKCLRVGMLQVRRCQRLSISTSLEEARMLDAVKWVESVDKGKIKLLHQQGHSVNGISEIQYIVVSESKT
jgi:hypothetical protein